MIITADQNDRVIPFHSFKFIELQHTLRDNPIQMNPILLKIYKNADHGGGKPTAKRIKEETDILVFLYKTLQLDLDI